MTGLFDFGQVVDDGLIVDIFAHGAYHAAHLVDLGRATMKTANRVARSKVEIAAPLFDRYVAGDDDAIGGGVEGKVGLGIGEVFEIEHAHELVVVEEELPAEIGVGGTQREGIAGKVFEVGFYVIGIEDGIARGVGLAEIAGIIEHEGTIATRGCRHGELVQPDGGAEDEPRVGPLGGSKEIEIGLLGGGGPIAVELDFAITESMGCCHLGNTVEGLLGEIVDIDGTTEQGIVDEYGGDDGELGRQSVDESDGGVGYGPLGRGDNVEKAEVEFADSLLLNPLVLRGSDLEGGAPIIDRGCGIGHFSPTPARNRKGSHKQKDY